MIKTEYLKLEKAKITEFDLEAYINNKHGMFCIRKYQQFFTHHIVEPIDEIDSLSKEAFMFNDSLLGNFIANILDGKQTELIELFAKHSSGYPDVMVLNLNEHRVSFVELKCEGYNLKKHQHKFLEELSKIHDTYVLHGYGTSHDEATILNQDSPIGNDIDKLVYEGKKCGYKPAWVYYKLLSERYIKGEQITLGELKYLFTKVKLHTLMQNKLLCIHGYFDEAGTTKWDFENKLKELVTVDGIKGYFTSWIHNKNGKEYIFFTDETEIPIYMLKNLQTCYGISDLQLQKMHSYQRPAKRKFFRYLDLDEATRIKKTYINGRGFTDYHQLKNNKKYQEDYNEVENIE